jgi:hypothetical protein
MISCNYNGWTDMPEEEREALAAFEAACPAPLVASVTPLRPPIAPLRQRKAA